MRILLSKLVQKELKLREGSSYFNDKELTTAWQFANDLCNYIRLPFKGKYSTNDYHHYNKNIKIDGQTYGSYVQTTFSYQDTASTTYLYSAEQIVALYELIGKANVDKFLEPVEINIVKYTTIQQKKQYWKQVSISIGYRFGKKVTNVRVVLPGALKPADAIKTIASELNKKIKSAGKFALVQRFFNGVVSPDRILQKISTTVDSKDFKQGIGRHSSSKTIHKVNSVYDVRNFVKKYGQRELINAAKDSLWWNKNVNSIGQGFLYTDQSWVDTYD